MSLINTSANGDCCNVTGSYESCGCVNGVAYVQLTIVGTTGHNVVWLNTETGDTFTTKPAGFVTGTCQEAALEDVLQFSATAPTATAPFATPKDGDTTIRTADGTATGNIVSYWRYDSATSTWKEIPVLPAGGTAGQVLTKLPDGTTAWVNPATQAIMDNQVLTGDTTTNTTVTMTPVTVTDESGGTQVNYTVKAEVKIDGTTIVQDPTTKVLSVVFPEPFKEANRWYVDPNGSDSNTGANEAPKLTAQAAVDLLTANDTAVLNEGTYAAVTLNVQNTALAGASSTYGSLSQIAAITVSTPSGTSNKISDLTVIGNLARTGNAPLYVNNTTVSGNVTLAGTAYTEIRDSSIQDGSITQSAASTLFIEDSKIGSSTFSTSGSTIAMRNVTIDAGDCVTIGAGVVYSLQDVNGCVNIDPAAVNAEQAAIAAGLTATQAEAAVTANFMHIRMHNADLEASPTQVVTRDPVTGELEYSTLASINTGAPVTVGVNPPTGTSTEGAIHLVTDDGTPTGTVLEQYIYDVDSGVWIEMQRNAQDTLKFGTAAPTAPGEWDGEEFFVTTTGTSAGTVTAQYIWDKQSTTWILRPSGGGAAPIHERDVEIATAAMTSHTLPDTPIGKVIVTRNGVDISDSWDWSGAVGTYSSAANFGCVIDAGDKLEFHYEKEATGGSGAASSSSAEVADGVTILGAGTSADPFRVAPEAVKSSVKARWSAITNLAANTTIPVANLTQTQINTTPSQWNATTGVYTAPAAGLYMVSANVSANATLATGSYFTIDVLKNGVSENTFVEQSIGGGGTVYITAGGAVPMLLAAGDTVSFTILANVASQTHIMGTNFSVTQL